MCGTGERDWRPGSRPSLPPLRSARTSRGSQGCGWWPLVSPRCRPSGCSWCGEESAILRSICSGPRLPGAADPPAPAGERAAGRGLWGVSGRPRPDSRWRPGPGFPHPPLGLPPPESRCIGTCRGEGAREGCEGGLRGGPSLGSPAPGLGVEEAFPLPPQGKFRATAFHSSFSQMVKRLGVPAGEGRGVCVAGWTPRPRWGRGLRS